MAPPQHVSGHIGSLINLYATNAGFKANDFCWRFQTAFEHCYADKYLFSQLGIVAPALVYYYVKPDMYSPDRPNPIHRVRAFTQSFLKNIQK
jgi:hypothetical protein